MAHDTYLGGCLCGTVRYRASGAATDLCFCHCTSCRRATGGVMVAWGTFAADRFAVTNGRLAVVESSPDVRRGFCAGCGTSITYQNGAHPGEIDVTLATLDDAARLEPKAHIWVADKLPWLRINDGLTQYAAGLVDS